MKEIMSIGERIKAVRKKLGLTQLILARIAGVNQSLIAQLESGAVINSSHLIDIAMALQVNAEWLKTGDGELDSGNRSHPLFEKEIAEITKLLCSTDERGRNKIITAVKDAVDEHRAWQKSLPKPARKIDEVAFAASRLGQELLSNLLKNEKESNEIYDQLKKKVRNDKPHS